MRPEAPCLQYGERITAWVDGELNAPAEVAALEMHIQVCEGCRIYAEAEVATKRLVAAGYAIPLEVGAVRTRIRMRLDAATAPMRRAFLLRVPRLAWGALAAGLLVALTIGYVALQRGARVEASPLVRAAVTDHVECMLGRLSLEVTTTDQEEVRQWLRARLAQPVGLPSLAPAGEATLSTRWARLGQAEGAQILVDRGGHMFSLFIMPGRELPGGLGRRVTRRGQEFFMTRLEGYAVVFWRNADLLYCLVAAGTEDQVLNAAAEYAGPPTR